jgi:Uma2 family endonuclease
MTQAATSLMTAEQFAELPSGGEFRHELIQGELVQMGQPEPRHGQLAFRIAFALGLWAREHGGAVTDAVGFLLQRHPNTLRAPDVTYFVPESAPHAGSTEFCRVPPDLAVEVNSPSDIASEVLDKVRWWLGHGTRQVWVVDDPTRTVTIYLPDGTARIIGQDAALTAPDLLPDFELPLAELFA